MCVTDSRDVVATSSSIQAVKSQKRRSRRNEFAPMMWRHWVAVATTADTNASPVCEKKRGGVPVYFQIFDSNAPVNKIEGSIDYIFRLLWNIYGGSDDMKLCFFIIYFVMIWCIVSTTLSSPFPFFEQKITNKKNLFWWYQALELT